MHTHTKPVTVPSPGSQTRLLSYHTWIHRNPGDRVILERTGCPPAHGTVDDIAVDASYFWVRIDGQSRTLVSPGYGSTIHKILT